jgi:hypothetical protein
MAARAVGALLRNAHGVDGGGDGGGGWGWADRSGWDACCCADTVDQVDLDAVDLDAVELDAVDLDAPVVAPTEDELRAYQGVYDWCVAAASAMAMGAQPSSTRSRRLPRDKHDTVEDSPEGAGLLRALHAEIATTVRWAMAHHYLRPGGGGHRGVGSRAARARAGLAEEAPARMQTTPTSWAVAAVAEGGRTSGGGWGGGALAAHDDVAFAYENARDSAADDQSVYEHHHARAPPPDRLLRRLRALRALRRQLERMCAPYDAVCAVVSLPTATATFDAIAARHARALGVDELRRVLTDYAMHLMRPCKASSTVWHARNVKRLGRACRWLLRVLAHDPAWFDRVVAGLPVPRAAVEAAWRCYGGGRVRGRPGMGMYARLLVWADHVVLELERLIHRPLREATVRTLLRGLLVRSYGPCARLLRALEGSALAGGEPSVCGLLLPRDAHPLVLLRYEEALFAHVRLVFRRRWSRMKHALALSAASPLLANERAVHEATLMYGALVGYVRHVIAYGRAGGGRLSSFARFVAHHRHVSHLQPLLHSEPDKLAFFLLAHKGCARARRSAGVPAPLHEERASAERFVALMRHYCDPRRYAREHLRAVAQALLERQFARAYEWAVAAELLLVLEEEEEGEGGASGGGGRRGGGEVVEAAASLHDRLHALLQARYTTVHEHLLVTADGLRELAALRRAVERSRAVATPLAAAATFRPVCLHPLIVRGLPVSVVRGPTDGPTDRGRLSPEHSWCTLRLVPASRPLRCNLIEGSLLLYMRDRQQRQAGASSTVAELARDLFGHDGPQPAAAAAADKHERFARRYLWSLERDGHAVAARQGDREEGYAVAAVPPLAHAHTSSSPPPQPRSPPPRPPPRAPPRSLSDGDSSPQLSPQPSPQLSPRPAPRPPLVLEAERARAAAARWLKAVRRVAVEQAYAEYTAWCKPSAATPDAPQLHKTVQALCRLDLARIVRGGGNEASYYEYLP